MKFNVIKKFNLKKINIFSKSVEQKRDQDGKFTAGSGGISKLQKLNWKRSLPVVVAVALVGGFLVFRSFAGVVKPSEYQYSIKDCKLNSVAVVDVTCRDESAEALTYRMSVGLTGAVPTQARHDYWVQKLAGDRVTSYTMAKSFLEAQEAKNTLILDNKAFVEQLFVKVLKRNSTFVADSEKDMYLKGLIDKKYDRAQVTAILLKSAEAKQKTSTDISKYVATRSFTVVKPVAIEKQKYRENQTRIYADDTFNNYKKADENKKEAENLLNEVKVLASKPKISGPEMDSISTKVRLIESKYGNAAGAYNAALKSYKNANEVYKTAKGVTAHSNDIPYTSIETWRNKSALYTEQSKNRANDIKNRLIPEIKAQYKIADTKYKSQCNSGQDYNGSTPGCGAPNPPRESAPIAEEEKPITTITCPDGRVIPKEQKCNATEAEIKAFMIKKCKSVPIELRTVRVPYGNAKVDFRAVYKGKKVNGKPACTSVGGYYQQNSLVCYQSTAKIRYTVVDTKRPSRGCKMTSVAPQPLVKGICVLPSPNTSGWKKYVKSYSNDYGVSGSTNTKSKAKKDVTKEFCTSRKSSNSISTATKSGYLIKP